MNRIILALALCIPSLAHAQLIIDNFSTNQAGGTEIGSVPAAVDGVRHLTPPDEFPFQTLVSAVSDGVFRCGMVGSAVTTTFATQSCTATWDGNNDGAPTIESGILGSGTPGGGLDLATGAIGIELGVTVSNAGQVEFRARNYDGSQCTLVSSQFGPNTVTVFLPFDVSGCLDANGQRPTDVRGISLTVLAKGTTVYTVSVGHVSVVPIPTYAVGGTLTGLSPGSTVTLQNNDGDDLVLDTDGPFIFPTEVIDQGNYDVNVATQPRDPLQLCTVNNGIGQVDGAPVDTIDVQCAPAFGVGGTVSGLRAPGLVLDLNGESMLLLEQDGPYTFPLGVADGGGYTVSPALTPIDHDCQVANPTGTISSANITDADVTCMTDILFSDGLETLSVDPIPID